MLERRELLLGLAATAVAGRAAAAPRPPLVLAAASLQESMGAAADAWARKGHARPVCSFAASSALARQIAAGAPADLFVSADEPWMDDLQRRGLLAPGTRAAFLGNRLVVVRPRGARGDIGSHMSLAALLGRGPLALADPDAVPAGKYAKAALTRLSAWNAVSGRVVRGESVRAALAFVERGAAPFGIVYATDARASSRVEVVRVLPAASHPPIRYPLARLKAATSPDAEPFRRFLLGREGRAIFTRFGFLPL
jgi:molybdate transport system substrate-binding protein